MALVYCTECGKQVSSLAKYCVNCGCPIAAKYSTKIRIKIDSHPNFPGSMVHIFDLSTYTLLKSVRSGSVLELESNTPLLISFASTSKTAMLMTTVEPGKRYHATWGAGWFGAKIVACSEVDVIDS